MHARAQSVLSCRRGGKNVDSEPGAGKKQSKSGSELTVKRLKSLIIFQLLFIPLQRDSNSLLLGGPNTTANLYCIFLSENETCTYADEVQVFGNIRFTQYNS